MSHAGEVLYCKECGQECQAKRVDNGIGEYEYWGERGVHHAYEWVSTCCEGELSEHPIDDDKEEEEEEEEEDNDQTKA